MVSKKFSEITITMNIPSSNETRELQLQPLKDEREPQKWKERKDDFTVSCDSILSNAQTLMIHQPIKSEWRYLGVTISSRGKATLLPNNEIHKARENQICYP